MGRGAPIYCSDNVDQHMLVGATRASRARTICLPSAQHLLRNTPAKTVESVWTLGSWSLFKPSWAQTPSGNGYEEGARASPRCGHSGFIPGEEEKTKHKASLLACAAAVVVVVTLDMCAWLSKASDTQAPRTQRGKSRSSTAHWVLQAFRLFCFFCLFCFCGHMQKSKYTYNLQTCQAEGTRTCTRRHQPPPKRTLVQVWAWPEPERCVRLTWCCPSVNETINR